MNNVTTKASQYNKKKATKTLKKKRLKIMSLYRKVLAAAQMESPVKGSIICIGSSHMQYWKSLKKDLSPLTIYNYGIGGSRMNHAADLFIDNLVIPFKPRAVILYEGSNDINSGTNPEEVLINFRKLYRKLHLALPNTRLYVIGIISCRSQNTRYFDKTNKLLAKECNKTKWITFIDVTDSMDRKPKKEIFKHGDIHMTPDGYTVWKSVIAPIIIPAEIAFENSK